MAKPSSVKKVPRKKVRVSRKRPNMGYGLFMSVLVVLGSLLVIISREDRTSAEDLPGVAVGEHWHAYLGVNICGEWLPNIPAYNAASGVHSHGDGFIHLHPQSSAGAHRKGRVGLYIDQAPGDNEITADSIEIEGADKVENGDDCKKLEAKDKNGGLRWSINGQEQPLGTNPSDHIVEDREVIAVAFLPKDVPIGTPPGASSSPSDETPTGEPTTTTVPGVTTTTVEGATTTTIEGKATTTSAPAATDESPTTTTTP